MKEKPTPPTLILLQWSRWYTDGRREKFQLSRVASHVRADRRSSAPSAENRRSSLARGLLRPPLHPPGAGVSPPAPLTGVPPLRPGGGRESRIARGLLALAESCQAARLLAPGSRGLCPWIPSRGGYVKAAYRGCFAPRTTTSSPPEPSRRYPLDPAGRRDV